MVKYLKMTHNCDLYNLKLGEGTLNANYSEYVTSQDEKKLLSLIDDVKDLMAKNWSLNNRSAFVKGKRYYWVTVNAKGHLRTMHPKCGIITDNVANMRYNYFEQEQDAEMLKDKIKDLFKRNGFPL